MKAENSLFYKIALEVKNYAVGFLRQVTSIIQEHNYDKKLGIETVALVYPEAAGTLGANKDGGGYQPILYPKLEKIFSSIPLAPQDIFIDIGCGKGRVVFFVATQKKVKKVIGVDFDKTLTDMADENLKNLKVPHVPIEIVNADITQYRFRDETLFFLYNPFGNKTMASTLAAIKDSLTANPRSIRILYLNARYRDMFDSEDWLIPEETVAGCCVWRSKAPTPSYKV